ncbi:hypothetical protein LIER_15137 [Lithospermum erythrorhizon]|uniref:Uncharacterized protein n=1 Tax=Lithospermum erythrorhizon TaxID=34254 RepID=A0AAV3Q1P9_LITER
MGLNEEYDVISNQILLKEPIPSLSKAFSMISQMEDTNAIHNLVSINMQNAMQAKTSFVSHGMARNNNYATNGASSSRNVPSSRNVLSNNSYENRSGPRVGKVDRIGLKFDYYGKSGDVKAGCYKFIDQEDDTPLNLDRIQGYDNKNDALQGMIASLVQKKMEKLM